MTNQTKPIKPKKDDDCGCCGKAVRINDPRKDIKRVVKKKI